MRADRYVYPKLSSFVACWCSAHHQLLSCCG
jgi:hypothetical protein